MTALAKVGRRTRAAIPTVGALAVVACYSFVLVWLMSTTPYDTWGGALFGPLLVVGSIPLVRRAAGDDDGLFWLLLFALTLKVLASVARYVIAAELYDGSADANVYANEGARLADAYRQGIFDADIGRGFIGTGALRVITGVLFMFTGATKLGGYMIFSWWAFWGLVAFYKAFTTAVPDGDHRRYRTLLLFLPSMLYWPSSIGKDAWMLLGLGAAALGAARLLRRRAGAVPLLVVGLAATAIVRPHITTLVTVGLTLAYMIRPGAPKTTLGPLSKPLGIVVCAGLMLVVIGQAQSYFDVEDEPGTGATQVLNRTADQTDTGGSEFDAVNARSVTDIPAAIVAVMFRPFPWEAGNVQALIAAVEGTVIFVLMLVSTRRLAGLPVAARRRPYLVLAAAYTLLFCVAFSSVGNFGILTRQRIQLLPFALVLLAAQSPSRVHEIDVTD